MSRDHVYRHASTRAYGRIRALLRPTESEFVMRGANGRTRYAFRQISSYVPQQWMASIDNTGAVLYVRMRGGNFSAQYLPDGEDAPFDRWFRILDQNLWETDDFQPFEFENETDRNKYMRRAVAACERWLSNEHLGVENVQLPRRFPLLFQPEPQPPAIAAV